MLGGWPEMTIAIRLPVWRQRLNQLPPYLHAPSAHSIHTPVVAPVCAHMTDLASMHFSTVLGRRQHSRDTAWQCSARCFHREAFRTIQPLGWAFRTTVLFLLYRVKLGIYKVCYRFLVVWIFLFCFTYTSADKNVFGLQFRQPWDLVAHPKIPHIHYQYFFFKFHTNTENIN